PSGAASAANTTRGATSSGDICGAKPPTFTIAVSTDPGRTDIACRPEPRSSSASDFTKPTTPHFDAQYGASPAVPRVAEMLAIATKRPAPTARIAGKSARVTRNTPFRFAAITASHSASVVS